MAEEYTVNAMDGGLLFLQGIIDKVLVHWGLTKAEQVAALQALYEKQYGSKDQLLSLQQEPIKAQWRNQIQPLVAPTNGHIQQLAVHTVGSVATPAQVFIRLFPRTERWRLL